MIRHAYLAIAVAVLVVAGGCSGSGGDIVRRGGEGEDFSPSKLVKVPGHDLMAEVDVEADIPVIPTVEVTGPDDHSFRLIEPAAAESHRLPVIGMHAASDYSISVTLRGVDGEPFGVPKEFAFTTGSLPDGLPELDTAVSEPAAMQAGVTLFNLTDLRIAADAGSDPSDEPGRGWLVMVDASGEVTWYHQGPLPYTDVRRLDDGNLLVEVDHTVGQELNLFGEVVTEWGSRFAEESRLTDAAIAVPVDSMHDEHRILPNGHHLTLSTELRTVAGFAAPLCGEPADAFDGSYELVGDVVVEFDPADGSVVHSWSLFDYYDPVSRPAAADLCATDPSAFPARIYPEATDPRDWTHADGVVLDEARNAILVSVAHLDEIVALRWQDDDAGSAGDVLWRMGPNGDLKLTSGEWMYHPHSPEIQKSGAILVYDSGDGRPPTDAGASYSRVVQFLVDDAAGLVSQEWAYQTRVDGQTGIAGTVGDADRQINGNVLIVDGSLRPAPDDVSSQIVEVTPDASPSGATVVFDLRVHGGREWQVDRAERLAVSTPLD